MHKSNVACGLEMFFAARNSFPSFYSQSVSVCELLHSRFLLLDSSPVSLPKLPYQFPLFPKNAHLFKAPCDLLFQPLREKFPKNSWTEVQVKIYPLNTEFHVSQFSSTDLLVPDIGIYGTIVSYIIWICLQFWLEFDDHGLSLRTKKIGMKLTSNVRRNHNGCH